MKLAFLTILLSYIVHLACCEKILFFWGLSTYSHRIVVWELVEELTRQGHEVTFLSPYPPKIPNPKVREIHPVELANHIDTVLGGGDLIEIRMKQEHRALWYGFADLGVSMCKVLLDNKEIQEWVKSSSYDLVIIDALLNECGIGFAYKFKAPFANFGTSSVFQWFYEIYGFSPESSWLPDLQHHYEPPMAFLEKVVNSIRPIHWYYLRHWTMFPQLEEMFREKLQMPQMPQFKELERNASLHLQNNFFATEWARAVPSIVREVGGIHIKDFNAQNINQNVGTIMPLPNVVTDFIGKNDFFYISFGSAVKISKLPEKFQQNFFDSLAHFEKQGLKFIFKWEKGVKPAISKIPKNVKLVSDWLPQQNVLAHPRLKGFMSHAGLLSIQESIFYAVPLVTCPIFAEQDYNAEKVQRNGYGIRLELSQIDENNLKFAIDQIVNNPSYKKKMLETSRLFKDRPMKPVETAIYWIEYVLRNSKLGNLDHMRSPGAQQQWWERRLLDVYLFLLGILILSLIILALIFKTILRIIFPPTVKSTVKKIKTK